MSVVRATEYNNLSNFSTIQDFLEIINLRSHIRLKFSGLIFIQLHLENIFLKILFKNILHIATKIKMQSLAQKSLKKANQFAF